MKDHFSKTLLFCFCISLLIFFPVSSWTTSGENEFNDNLQKEVELSLSDVPIEVQLLIEKYAGSGHICTIDKIMEMDKVTYLADIIVYGREMQMEITADGRLLSHSIGQCNAYEESGKTEKGQEVNLEDLPPAVITTVVQQFGFDSPLKVEKRTRCCITTYEVAIKSEGIIKDAIKVLESGEILDTEKPVDPNGLPSSVIASITRDLPKSSVKKVNDIPKLSFDVSLILENEENEEEEGPPLPNTGNDNK